MLSIKNLSYTVNENDSQNDIIKNIDLDIESGRFVVITGPNGGGKTTLARLIMGLAEATSGSIKFNGTELIGKSVSERAKLGVSYGFQQPPRFKGLRVIDLLSIASAQKLKRADCCKFLTQVGLCAEEYVDREIDASLSGGELKRIEIASVLAHDAPLMIFDEPEAGIDLWSFSKLTETFAGIHRRSESTIIIISHQERIIRLADELIIIADGEIKKKGSVDEVFPHIMDNADAGCSYMEAKAEDCK